MGLFSCCTTRKVQEAQNTTSINRVTSGTGIKPLGVSVHWLKHGFMEEVKERDYLSENSNIYQIEDLSSERNGVIRSKGEKTICPHDGKIGAAYVDCLEGEDNVGPANLMLSYGWRYEIKDIVDTLLAYCKSSELEPERTYVWICCLCNNQHRVVESMKNKDSSEDTFEDFQRIFHDRVVDIGHVVALMCPWEKPVYLTRIWCIFELYIASEDDNCILTIAMPPLQKKRMIEALRRDVGVEELYKNLSATKVEDAEASQELDRKRILEMVRNGPGYHEMNRKVNVLIRAWVKNGLLQSVSDYKKEFGDVSLDPDYANLCNDVGKVMTDEDALEESATLFHDAISTFEACNEKDILLDKDRRALADTHNNFGLLLKKKGDYSGSKVEFNKAMQIGKTIWDEHDYGAAQTYNNIGLALDDMKEYDEALAAYQEAQKIVEICLGKDHVNVAGAISNIAYLLDKMGRSDEAIVEMKKVIAIDEKSNGLNHPDTANSYNILGVILSQQGDHEAALEWYQKALLVREKVFGNDSLVTGTMYHNIGSTLYDLKKYEEAMVELQKAFNIFSYNVGEDHPECKVTTSYIDLVKEKMGKN